MKLNILIRIIKFWIHLESLPENSIAIQCLLISSQLANEAKTPFMLTVNEIIHNYIDIQHQSCNKTIQTNDIPMIKNNLQKLKCHICCKLVQNLLKTQLTKQTQRSKVLHNRHVRHVNSRRRSSAGWPIKGQGTPSRRGALSGSTILQQHLKQFKKTTTGDNPV